MNILLDFIPFQFAGGIGGAATFTKAVTDETVSRKGNAKLYAMYDSSLQEGLLYNVFDYAKANDINLLDISKERIADIIRKYKIDTMFISIGQFFAAYDLNDISCKTIMFIHDIFDVERNDNDIDKMLERKDLNVISRLKRRIAVSLNIWKKRSEKKYAKILPLYRADNTVAYTVSNYTQNSLEYYFGIPKDKIHVCYPPLRHMPKNEDVENSCLKNLISSNEPYLLFMGANREYKNFAILMKVFPQIRRIYPQLKLLTLSWSKKTMDGQIDIPFLSDSDLRNAYANAKALIFPSFFEGFGYPPVEAIGLGTPVVASNVTSIPEVTGNSCISFSPFYPADLYRAIIEAVENGDKYKANMTEQYNKIVNRQISDLKELTDNILN